MMLTFSDIALSSIYIFYSNNTNGGLCVRLTFPSVNSRRVVYDKNNRERFPKIIWLFFKLFLFALTRKEMFSESEAIPTWHIENQLKSESS